MQRIGILGGTFDPVHFGHLRPAVEVKAALGLQAMRLIPCRVSPHREAPLASGEQRRELLEAAVAGMDDLVVDDRELARDGPSYTVDTLESILADVPDARLYLVIGADAATAFERWHRWRDLLELANLVITYRPGWSLKVPGVIADRRVASVYELRARAAGAVLVQAVTQLDIRATAIRELAAAGGDLRYLLPERVHHRIQELGLYSNPETPDPNGD